MTDKCFVVAITDNVSQKRKFLGYDASYGYVFNFDDSLNGASFFTKYEALKQYNAILNSKPQPTTDGTIYPPIEIHRGLDICNIKERASGVLSIIELKFVTVETDAVAGEIKRPTGYTYA